MHKYGANKTTQIMMATVRHVTAWAGRTKFQIDGFLFIGVYIQELGEIFPSPSQNTVPVCNQIIFLVLYYITSRLVTLLKVTDAPTQVSNIFYLTVSFTFLKFSFQISLLFFPEMSANFKFSKAANLSVISI